MEPEKRSRTFKLSKMWSVIHLEPEQVLLLLMSLQIVNKKISF